MPFQRTPRSVKELNEMRTETGRAFVRMMLLAVILAMRLGAQGDRGVITGTVTDSSGAVVPGAVVTTVQGNTNASYKTTTSTTGDFTVTALPVGTYLVTVEKPGFKKHLTAN